MFTGIIEATGVVVHREEQNGIKDLYVRSIISPELRPDQSVCHDGVCLTVVSVEKDIHRVQLVQETILRSHFADVFEGMILNLERSMPAQGRFEGHIVQGHVDCVGTMIAADDGLFSFSYPEQYAKFLVEKGSVCINGVSLTLVSIRENVFTVALIPYTLEHTNLGHLKPGRHINLEFDILAKHLVRIIELRGQTETKKGMSH